VGMGEEEEDEVVGEGRLGPEGAALGDEPPRGRGGRARHGGGGGRPGGHR
jgi:hypothetical protein